MKIKDILYIGAVLIAVGCSSDELLNNGGTHPNGAIELRAGIVEGGSTATRRAPGEENADHTTHLALQEGTKLALRVRGTWTGHAAVGSTTPGEIVYTPTATVGAETSTGSKHNTLGCSPTLYWDDYGSADPANYYDANKADDSNPAYGRGVGLTIYGVAIDGKKDAAPAVSDWNALPWTLSNNQAANNEKPADKDLLISNNVSGTKVTDKELDTGNYKFDEKDYGKLLEFRHALSKITVNLKAGDGFDGAFGSTTVQLTSNEGTPNDATAWPIITGKVNVTNGSVDITSPGQGTHSAITMYHNTSATLPTGYHAVHEALVMPGSAFKKDAIIARINADGNIYYVNSTKIREAINAEAHNTDDLTEAGKNYIINVVVNKTAIEVTATVVDWTTVNAAEVAPIINITANFPNPIISRYRYDQFSFYRSLSDNGINDGYSFGDDANLIQNGFYKPESRITHTTLSLWGWDPQRYWSNHNQHYQFRLVWPRTTTDTKETDPNHPHVERKSYDDGSTYQQVIEIFNEPYEALYTESDNGTDPVTIVDDATHHPYPSNLMIARPEFMADDPSTTDVDESDPICTNNEPGHTHKHLYSEGICAREGEIVLTFRYVMSQVEVNLTTTSTESSVDLNGATVAITNVYSKGDVKLGDRGVIQTSNIGNYTLDPVAVVVDDPATEEIDENTVSKRKRHSAIVPQMLTFSTARASTNVQFKITLGNGDVYYADIQPIPVQEAGSSIPAAPVTAWESGKHYVYNLNVSKTQIKATATLANWTTVEASEEVWF